jgi:hypothetical protein
MLNRPKKIHMPDSLIVIVGGASVDPAIKDFFENYDLYVEHYNARKSADLKKQNVPRNTVGVIITVDRSHMAFGNSNELTRFLKNNNIPFVFSSGNFATFNSAKILFQQIHKQFPNLVKPQEPVSEKEQKLENYKQEWQLNQEKVLKYIGEWLEILADWEIKYLYWKKVLDEWKIILLEWKDIMRNEKHKSLKKQLNKFPHLGQWKEEIHGYGIQIESKLNILKEWKVNIEGSCNELINTQEKLKAGINNINNLNDKNFRSDFRNWKTDFYLWADNLDTWQKEFNEWKSVLPELFTRVYEWQQEIRRWNSNKERNINQ